jgi:hypothetical protein
VHRESEAIGLVVDKKRLWRLDLCMTLTEREFDGQGELLVDDLGATGNQQAATQRSQQARQNPHAVGAAGLASESTFHVPRARISTHVAEVREGLTIHKLGGHKVSLGGVNEPCIALARGAMAARERQNIHETMTATDKGCHG